MPLWNPLRPDGCYQNPILWADYSDPDVIRVGEDYYLTSSSFSCVPGLPILHSRDLIHWTIIGHALPRLVPAAAYQRPQPGKGVWAPALRHHEGRFHLYYPDPDHGIFLVTAADPRGPWSEPIMVRSGRGLIDPCPLWDEEGKTYLIHGWAKSRAGINNRLSVVPLAPDGTRITGAESVAIDGDAYPGYHTLEGPKWYRRAGYYYVFAPAGGVAEGWQSVFRSRHPGGPYEARIVLAQRETAINGPHQGALVDTPGGQSWFFHFQDRGPYGRVVHLQPVVWHDDWPLIGRNVDVAGCGEPVLAHSCPLPRAAAGFGGVGPIPQTSDEFETGEPGPQWQWQANPQPDWIDRGARPGRLRLRCAGPLPGGSPAINLSGRGSLLLQKFPAPEFTVRCRLDFSAAAVGDHAGLVVFGADYAWIGLRQTPTGLHLVQVHCADTEKGSAEVVQFETTVPSPRVDLEVTVAAGALCRFAFRAEGNSFVSTGGPAFAAKAGRWVGAKLGLLALSAGVASGGRADFDRFRFH